MNVTSRLGLAALSMIVAIGLPAAEWPELTGKYFDQPVPVAAPEVFALGVISHGFHELGITFSPDGDEIFFITSDARYRHYVLLHSDRRDGRWSEPSAVGFAAHLSVYSVSMGPDGHTLYFTGRPRVGTVDPRPEHDVFRVTRKEGEWGKARNLGLPVKTEASESSVSVAADGSLYFARRDSQGSSDIWVARAHGERLSSPVRIGSPVSTASEEARPFIDRDQRFLLFHSNREGSLGSMNLFISVRESNGTWAEPTSLGPGVNSTASDFGPSVSPDGRFLFFSSYRGLDPGQEQGLAHRELLDLYRRPANGYATLYWIDAAGLIPTSP